MKTSATRIFAIWVVIALAVTTVGGIVYALHRQHEQAISAPLVSSSPTNTGYYEEAFYQSAAKIDGDFRRDRSWTISQGHQVCDDTQLALEGDISTNQVAQNIVRRLEYLRLTRDQLAEFTQSSFKYLCPRFYAENG